MEVREFFSSENKEYWVKQIERADWGAAKFLTELLTTDKINDALGENALVLMLTDSERLMSFCTFAPLDEVQPTSLSPWIGFVYTFPEYRGHHYAGQILDYAECLATIMGQECIYISTDHIGLYEKYGYEFFEYGKDIGGEQVRIYRKVLDDSEGPDTERRMLLGSRYKSKLITAAKKGTDPIAYCGLSCKHCFLSERCGGCKSYFSCCSFGTMFEKEKCPNAKCAEDKGIAGCYECSEIEKCRVGFYDEDSEGADAGKAMAMFIARHGRGDYIRLQDYLHKKFEYDRLQEILPGNLSDNIIWLEKVFEDCDK